jgi:hypothetical protein
MSALASYGSVLGELTPLVALTFALLIVMGVAMWLAERSMRPHGHESSSTLCVTASIGRW